MQISKIVYAYRFTFCFCFDRAYNEMNVKHETLSLITPQFETPLPPLEPSVSGIHWLVILTQMVRDRAY